MLVHKTTRALQNRLVVFKFQCFERFVEAEPDIVVYLFALNYRLCVFGFCQKDGYALFDLALNRVVGFCGEVRNDVDVYPGLFKNFAPCSLLGRFAALHVTFGESPVGTAAVLDKKKSDLAVYSAAYDGTARALVETLEAVCALGLRKGERIGYLIADKTHIFRRNDKYALALSLSV